MKLQASQLSQWVDGSLTQDITITGLKVDQRLIEPGDLFVCLKGEQVDGHAFAQAAVDQGAVCLMVDHALDIDVPQILVDDTFTSLVTLGKAYRNYLDVFIIGITGSNGKTSTKDILHSILPNSVATHMNQNTIIGTVLNLFRMDETTKYGIFELGLDEPTDVIDIAVFLEPDAGIITSLAPAHMANFETIGAIAKAKFDLFNYVKNPDLCFYQGDFKEYRELATTQKSFGFNQDNDIVATDIRIGNDGVHFSIEGVSFHCNLLGEHQASNSAGVIALLKAMNMNDDIIQKGLNRVALTSLRTELVQKDQALILLDAYKSNRSSLQYALDILVSYDHEGPLSVFISDMVELGEISQTEHFEVLNTIASLPIKHVYTIGTEFEKALAKSNLDSSRLTNTTDFTEFKTQFKQVCQEKGMILVKGSRSYALERLMKED